MPRKRPRSAAQLAKARAAAATHCPIAALGDSPYRRHGCLCCLAPEHEGEVHECACGGRWAYPPDVARTASVLRPVEPSPWPHICGWGTRGVAPEYRRAAQ